jgi:hypothetical protein
MGKISEVIDLGDEFLNQSPVTQKIIARINKWDCIKLLHTKGNNQQSKEIAYRIGKNLCQ